MALRHPDDEDGRKARKRRSERFAKSVLEIPTAPILRNYGIGHQLRKTVEELDELLEEIKQSARWWRDGKTKLSQKRRAALVTECADVAVMCSQILRLYQVVWPSPAKPSALLVVRARSEALALKKDIERFGKDQRVPTAFHMLMQAVRLGVAVSDRDTFQAEVNFKIERQLARIEDERIEREAKRMA